MNLINEASPHFHGDSLTWKIMGAVCLALVPTLIASTVLYGLAAPLLVLVCISTALVCEHLCCIAMHRQSTAGDLSCVVTAMLFAFTLPADCPFWVAVLGTAFAIVIVKMLFGGIGCNVFNPAVAARVFVMVALPSALSAYPDVLGKPLDAVTGATPLAMASAGDMPYSYLDLLLGNHAGALGDGLAHGLVQLAVDGGLTFEPFDLPAEIDHVGLHFVVGRGVLGREHAVCAALAVEERFGGVPRLGALFAQFKNLVHGKFLLFRRPRIAGL